jgi:hypothetical protein
MPNISAPALRSAPLRLLIEGDADSLFFAPNDPAGQMIAPGHQGELLGDSERAGDLQGRTGRRDVADGAIDRAAAELDLSGFEDPLSVCNPVLVHRIVMLQNSREWTGRFRKETLDFAKASAIGNQKSGSAAFPAVEPGCATARPARPGRSKGSFLFPE